jgi:heme exporter protein B
MSGPFAAIVARDLRLAARRRADALLPIAFFTVAISLFPLGVGPEPQTLRQIAPGVVWVAALLAAMLSVTQLYAGDLADGSLEQMLVASGPGTLDKLGLVLAKAAAHWLVTGLPLVIVAPLFGLMFDMRGEAIAPSP